MPSRLLRTGHLDGATNMAIDEMLLINSHHLLKQPYQVILRLYGWSKPTLSLGYFQSPSLIINSLRGNNQSENFSFDIVRRLTGGATILHDIEVTYSFIIAENSPLVPAETTESYKVICYGIIKGLEKVGVKAEFFKVADGANSKDYAAKSDFCFANHSKYDVVFDAKKLVGSAQRRKNGLILQHGSIILDIDEQRNRYLLAKGINCFQEAVSLKNILGWRLDFEQATQILVEGFRLALGIDFKDENLTSTEIKLAEVLKKDKYETAAWTNRIGVIK